MTDTPLVNQRVIEGVEDDEEDEEVKKPKGRKRVKTTK